MSLSTETFQTLKDEFNDMIEQCKQIQIEKEERFQRYRERIHQELAELTTQRELFDQKLKKMKDGVQECEMDDTWESTATLPVEDQSDDEVEQCQFKKIESFLVRKETKRLVRLKKAHQDRVRTILSINNLYKSIAHVTQIQAYVDPEVIGDHFNEESSVQFQAKCTVDE